MLSLRHADAALPAVLLARGGGGPCCVSARRRLTLFNLMDALALFPYDGAEVQGAGRKQPTYIRRFGEWNVVWWVDVPVGEVQVLLVERRRNK